LHRHGDKKKIHTERLYVSRCNYGSRAFKYNLPDILAPLCVKDEAIDPMIGWDEKVNNNELEDHQYTLFESKYFGDLFLEKMCLKNIIKSRQTEQLYQKNKTIISLKTNKKYSYTPEPIEYYECINHQIGEYYKSQGVKKYNDQFLKYIIDNELEEEPLEDNFGNISDCVLIDFDDNFPIHDSNVDKDKFIFKFLQTKYYFFVSV